MRIILEMIKFEHTLFALPFAVMSAFLAARGVPSLDKLFWILVAMVGARSCAMAFNRLADARYDAENPRTKMRAVPAGLVSRRAVWVFTVVSGALLIVAAWRLNPLAFALSPVALATIMGYSLSKRFTSLSHAWLGLSLAIAPVGAWIAVRGRFDVLPLLLAAIVLLWVSGFDIIYACQDVEFDRARRLRSVPARMGVRGALVVSTWLHVVMFGLLASLPMVAASQDVRLGLPYGIGILLVAALLVYEHAIVKPHDLSRVNAAFFTLNGAISLVLMGVCIVDVVF
ncbi:4-hydroxybenzoate octaprenyltransferase [Candidatus Poribacteria bacterium]|nr:4-hydroxybenzoate octaprenyltransferase [Candidatus Poribacteria bacterium]